MRVALIDPSLFTLPYDRSLIKGLVQAGHDPTLYARRPDKDDGCAEGIHLVPDFYKIAHGKFGTALPKRLRLALKGVDHLASMTRLLRRLRRERPDVIHFQWLPLPVVDRRMLAWFGAVAPLVLTVHDTNPFNGDPSAALQQHGFFRCMDAFHKLIVHTGQGRERLLAQGLPSSKIVVLPHGLLSEPPPASPPDPMQGTLTLLLFGKIKPYKGVDVLIEAFARLPAELQAQARMRVVGKPYMDVAPLLALAETHGVLDRLTLEQRFVPDSETDALFAPGSVAVFPYREIEASGVLSLALARARPVVASDLGNFTETIEDGVQGHLVPPGDVAALSAALAHLISDRSFAASCSNKARQLADQTPGWDEIGRRTANVYADAGAAAPALVAA